MDKRFFENHHTVLALIALLGFGLRAWGISDQPPLADEVTMASSATAYMEHGIWSMIMWEHPPLRNVVIYVSGKIFGGYTAWGLRGGSILCGSLSALLLGYLAYSLFNNKTVSYLAAFFLCIDPLHIGLTREAVQEGLTAFFILAGVLAAYHALKKDNIFLCYFSGALFGFASASKWHGLFPWAVSAIAYLCAPWFIKQYTGSRNLPLRLLNTATAFLIIPLVVYVAVYIPWLNRGHSLAEFVDFQIILLKGNFTHRASFYSENYLLHSASLWFLWPMAWADFVVYQGKPYLGLAMGNFLVWVLTLPSLYYGIRKWGREKGFELGFALALFLASYLPLVPVSRGVWVFSAPAVIPFAFLLTSYSISEMLKTKRISKKSIVIYLVIISLVSALMYPLSTLRSLEYPYLKPITELYSPHGDEQLSHERPMPSALAMPADRE